MTGLDVVMHPDVRTFSQVRTVDTPVSAMQAGGKNPDAIPDAVAAAQTALQDALAGIEPQ